MGRSSSNSNLISGESPPGTSTYIPNFPGQHHSLHYVHTSAGGGHTHLPSPPPPPHNNSHHHHSQYLSHLANAAHFYEVNNSNGAGSSNVTPPVRVYSPLSHGSSNSSGSSVLSFVSGSGGGTNNNSNGNLTIMDSVNCVKYDYDDFPQEPDGGPVKIGTWKDHVAVFSIDQVGVMCDVLLQEGDMSRLVDLLSTVAKDFMGRSEKILRAQAHVAFHSALEDPRKFPQVYKILESNSFSPEYHSGLQKLWFSAHYKEAEITRGRPLGAVDKYRIRRKFPLPRTIWDGEETVYCFKERSRNALRESFRLEKYPNLEEKKKLSKETGLTMTQVGNWFKNKRQREKEKEQGKAAAKRSKSAYSSPVGLAAMTPDLLGMMFSTNGGAALNQAHLPSHHHHHPSLQQHITPMSPEDFENAIRKARFADEAHRIKSYVDDGGIYSNSSPNLSHYHTNGNAISINSNTGNGMSPNGNSHNDSSSPRHAVLPGKSDIIIGIVNTSSSGGSNGGHHHQSHHQHPSSPRSANGLTITAVPSPPDNNGRIHQQQHSPDDNGSGMSSSPDAGGGGEMYINRPVRSSSNCSSGTLRCGAGLVPYNPHSVYHGQHHHLQGHLQHHHHSVASPLPGGYESGIVPLMHNNSAAAALSHA